MLPLQGPQVQSLVRELRFRVLCTVAKKKRKERKYLYEKRIKELRE